MNMEANESIERVIEGLKKAASCARQLGRAQKKASWGQLAHSLDALRDTAQKLYDSKPLTYQQQLQVIDRMVADKVISEGGAQQH